MPTPRIAAALAVFAAWLPALASAHSPATAAPPPAASRAHAAARAALAPLQARTPGLQVHWQRDGILPEVLAGMAESCAVVDPVACARAFVHRHQALIGHQVADLRLVGVRTMHGRRVVTFERAIAGAPVLERHAAVAIDDAHRVVSLSSDLPLPGVVAPRAIAAAEAQRRAVAAVAAAGPRPSARPPAAAPAEAVIWPNFGSLRPAWAVWTVAVPGVRHERVVIDAVDGSVLDVRNEVQR